MVDVFLIVSIVVALGILFVAGLYLLVYYQHPDDHNDAYFPKFVVILGFMLAGATVLMLPLDVANNEGFPGTCVMFCLLLLACVEPPRFWNTTTVAIWVSIRMEKSDHNAAESLTGDNWVVLHC